jgi:pyruvate,water dikinase
MKQINPQEPPVQGFGNQPLVLWIEQVGTECTALVGEQTALLGEIARRLGPKGVKIATSFTITSYAYKYFLEATGLESKLNLVLADIDLKNPNELHQASEQARCLILNTPIPRVLATAIANAYYQLSHEKNHDDYTKREYRNRKGSIHDKPVHIQSRIDNIDQNHDIFDGCNELCFSVSGVHKILEACLESFASLFSEQFISERSANGTCYKDVFISIGIQRNFLSALAPYGKAFSVDLQTGLKNFIAVTANLAVNNNLVLDTSDTERYLIVKPTLKEGYLRILAKHKGDINSEKSYNRSVDKFKYFITDEEIMLLAKWAYLIEDCCIEICHDCVLIKAIWAKDMETGEIFVLQISRLFQPLKSDSDNVIHNYKLSGKSKVLIRGTAVGQAIGQGKVRVISDISELSELNEGEILVTVRTDPVWRPMMSKASAIITDQGGRTCHSAICAREMQIPAVVGCGTATSDLQTGQEVTVSCADGDEGKVYQGLLHIEDDAICLSSLPQTKTKILINVGNPEDIARLATLPCDGVGVARMEFLIANQVKIHPLALVEFDELRDDSLKHQIADLTMYYDHKPDYFVDKVAEGIGMIAAAFYPKPVLVRTSDFKSNEYANLLGGQLFEKKEENPMIGWRGASRYCDKKYNRAFHLECQAIRRVRDEIGLTNVIILIPFCRTPDEGNKVLAEMATQGLVRGKNGLQFYIMCETPSNVLLADQFCKIFDGFSIGSNDLTQLILGVDRDSEDVAHHFDERNEAVKEMIRLVIEKAKKHNRKIGICGQAPSDYPDIIDFLVELGIDSISLSPDTLIRTLIEVSKVEQRMKPR